jgi:hypothetical protein
LREHTSKDLVVMLVGNKTDLAHLREVPAEHGRVSCSCSPACRRQP